MRPIKHYQFYHGTSAIYDPSMRPIVDDEFVGLGIHRPCPAMKFFLMGCKEQREEVFGDDGTSIRYWKDFRSLNLNELPMDMVYR